MKIIIFAGGAGKRLWPLSRRENPKQFHKIFGEETTLENSYNTIKSKFKIEDIFISTNEKYAEHVRDVMPNIPDENIIIEPDVRDTAAAVAFAMAHIAVRFPDEPVVIRWQNSLIKNPSSFTKALDDADEIFKNGEADFVYLSVPAKYPNTGVGYIHLGSKIRDLKGSQGLFGYVGFKEKPDIETAREYEKNGNYAWNPGCYITTPRFVLEKLSEVNPNFYSHIKNIQDSLGTANESEVINREFPMLEKTSIDYLLWEHLESDGIKVVLADYDWHYVSTWDNLKDALSTNIDSTVTTGNVLDLDSKNSLIYNYEDNKIVVGLEIEDLVVVNTPDALVVVPKDKASKIKDLLAKLEEEGLSQYL